MLTGGQILGFEIVLSGQIPKLIVPSSTELLADYPKPLADGGSDSRDLRSYSQDGYQSKRNIAVFGKTPKLLAKGAG